jgi:inosine/xanthosine triphosphate pyrophosphatase family protein
MADLTFVTGNSEKFSIAHKVFAARGLSLQQASHDIDEIQGKDSEKIVKDKVQKAYENVGGAVLVNDDSWAFLGLDGFPGPYMKDVASWFSADDFINLTRALADRRVVLTQWIAYQDSSTQKLFKLEHTGEVLTEKRGNYGNSLQKVISMPGDNGKSVAEAYDAGVDTSEREVSEGYNAFLEWYIQEYLR